MHFYASSLHSLTVKVVCNPHDEAASAGALGQLPASFWRPGRLSTPAANWRAAPADLVSLRVQAEVGSCAALVADNLQPRSVRTGRLSLMPTGQRYCRGQWHCSNWTPSGGVL